LEVALRWLGADVAEAHAALDQGLSLHDPIFIPYLAGERTPFMDPNLRGSWLGLSLNTDRNAMLRSVLVGLAQATALAVEAVFPESDRTPLLILGGGTRDERFRALLADAVNRELLPTVVPAQGVVGAAQLAMGRDPAPPATRTHIAPRPDQVDLLREKRQAMVQAMHPA
jgi:xylulokinase